MKKIFVLIAISAGLHVRSTAQQLYQMNINKFLVPKNTPDKKITEAYLDTIWREANITLYNSDQALDGLPAKYELRSNLIEIRLSQGDVRVLYVERIKTLTLKDALLVKHYFVNGKDFLIDNMPVNPLIEVLSSGKISLYKLHTYTVLLPNENKALGVGSPDERVILKSQLFYSLGKDLIKVPSKNKFLSLFGDDAPSVEKYMKEKSLKASRQDDLVSVLNYYNALKD